MVSTVKTKVKIALSKYNWLDLIHVEMTIGVGFFCYHINEKAYSDQEELRVKDKPFSLFLAINSGDVVIKKTFANIFNIYM